MASDGVTPVRLWVRGAMQRALEGRTPEAWPIAEEVAKKLQEEPRFTELLREMVLQFAVSEARFQLRRRPAATAAAREQAGSSARELVQVAQSQLTVLDVVERFEGMTKRLRDMTKSDLIAAAMEREDDAESTLKVSMLYRKLAQKMPPRQVGEAEPTVGSSFRISDVVRAFAPIMKDQGTTDYHRFYLGLQRAQREQLEAAG